MSQTSRSPLVRPDGSRTTSTSSDSSWDKVELPRPDRESPRNKKKMPDPAASPLTGPPTPPDPPPLDLHFNETWGEDGAILPSEEEEYLTLDEDIARTTRRNAEIQVAVAQKAADPQQATARRPPVTVEYLPIEKNLCWRCGNPGHSRQHCTGPTRIFCSRCGRCGILSRTCSCQEVQPTTRRPLRTPPTTRSRHIPPLRKCHGCHQFIIREEKGIQCNLLSTPRVHRPARSVKGPLETLPTIKKPEDHNFF